MESDADDFCNSVLNQNRDSLSRFLWSGAALSVSLDMQIDVLIDATGTPVSLRSRWIIHPWTYDSDPRLRLDNPSLMSYFVVRPGSTRLKYVNPLSREPAVNGTALNSFRFIALNVFLKRVIKIARRGSRGSRLVRIIDDAVSLEIILESGCVGISGIPSSSCYR